MATHFTHRPRHAALIAFAIALALGFLLGPALRARLGVLAGSRRWQGAPMYVFANVVAGLPFAALATSPAQT